MGLLDHLKKALQGEGGRAIPPPVSTATASSSWLSDNEWRTWDPPLSIVAGESHYRTALEKIAGPPRPGGWLVPCEADLRREPENRYDPDAIAVYIDGGKVGHIAADACSELAPAMDQHGGNARATGIPALVRGGWLDRPNLGVMLWLNHEKVQAALPEVDWEWLIEDFACHGWPPDDGEGSELTAAPTSTGRERSHVQGPRPGSEPRTPPLTEHYASYVEDVKELKRRKEHERAEALLLALIEAVEAESDAEGVGVAPWYYEQLAIVRRKRGDLDGEVAILERFAAMPHAPGAATPKVLARLDDAKARPGRKA